MDRPTPFQIISGSRFGREKHQYKQKKILLIALDSPFLDNEYVFPYLGILYLVSVAAKNGMRPKFVDKRSEVTPR